MSEEQAENDLSVWLSTYGLITAERVLERYKIRLNQKDLLTAIKNPSTFYHRLMRVPLKNVLNGIILQQAQDYQIYAQKLFVDFLMSGESEKSQESPGGTTREDLEAERKQLVSFGEDFEKCELEHNQLIANSQKGLMQIANDWQINLSNAAQKIKAVSQSHGMNKEEHDIIHAINTLLIQHEPSKGTAVALNQNDWARAEHILQQSIPSDLKQVFVEEIAKLGEFTTAIDTSLGDFAVQVSEMTVQLRKWRTNFYNFILHVNELLRLLPDYQLDPIQTQENRESLYFDSGIGEQEED